MFKTNTVEVFGPWDEVPPESPHRFWQGLIFFTGKYKWTKTKTHNLGWYTKLIEKFLYIKESNTGKGGRKGKKKNGWEGRKEGRSKEGWRKEGGKKGEVKGGTKKVNTE